MILFPIVNPFLIAAAVIPALILMRNIYRADRVEPEPTGLLLALLLRGIMAAFLAGIGNGVLSAVLGAIFPEDSLIFYFCLFFLVVGPCEEGFKFLLLKRRTWNSREFNCRFDGIVYAAFVALGFALIENVEYVFRFGMGAALVRAVTAVPGHASFGVFMGAFYGVARQAANRGDAAASKRLRRMAWLVPAVLHGLYDFSATLSGGWTFGFTVFVILLFITASRIVKTHAAADTYI